MRFIVLAIFLIPSHLFAQSSPFVDSIVSLVITHQIPVYDSEFHVIDNDSVRLFRRDTVVNGIWTRPKFYNLQYQPGFDGKCIESPIWLDTLTLETHPGFLAFIYEEYLPTSYADEVYVAFLIRKTATDRRQSIDYPSELLTAADRPWRISSVHIDETYYVLDSCQRVYQLEINDDFTFKQYYGADPMVRCSTPEMAIDKVVGIEGVSKEQLSYLHLIRGHILDQSAGQWRMINGRLYFFDKALSRKLISYAVIAYQPDELVLQAGTTTVTLVK